MRFRPPGVKPGGKIGPLGPFRGRLGAHWWIAAVVVGLLLLGTASWILFRASKPGEPWQPVGRIERIQPGSAREVLEGAWVGRLADGRPVGVQEAEACPLSFTDGGYKDCFGRYGLDGRGESGGVGLTRIPVQVYKDEVFVDLTRPLPPI